MAANSSNLFVARDFRTILEEEYGRRKTKRRNYSIRAFARDIGLPSGTLFGVMQGRYGISSERAVRIAKKIGLDDTQAAFFADLVESKHARTKTARAQAALRLAQLRKKFLFQALSEENIALIDKWFYPAVLERMLIDRRATPTQVASSLKLSEVDVLEAIDVLQRLKIIKKTAKGYMREKQNLYAESPVSSASVRGFHSQLLDKAKVAVETQPLAKRKNQSAVFSIDSQKIPEAREWLANAYQEFVAKFVSVDSGDAVYALGMQLFQLDDGVRNDE